MSTASEQARAAAKSKAERLVRADPNERVDASGYKPDGAMNADVVAGMRPVSRRQYRRGGKVAGESSPARADRKPRASGGALTDGSFGALKSAASRPSQNLAQSSMRMAAKQGTDPYNSQPAQASAYKKLWTLKGGRPERASGGNVTAYMNRDMKEANKERGGLTHEGGMKRGGRMARAHGGSCSCAKCSGGRVAHARGGPAINDGTRPVAGRMARKGGGRAKGKTNINIIVAPQGGARPAMPPPGAGMPPGGPVGLRQGVPPPAPVVAGAPPPAGLMPPSPRASGGRTGVGKGFGAKLIKPGKYPIETGSGGGLGRLEKAERARGRA